MPQTILVPIDIDGQTPPTEQIAIAEALAKPDGGRLIVLSVQPAIPSYVRAQLPPEVMDASRQTVSARLDGIVRDHAPAVPTEHIVRLGRPGQEILEHAREHAVDLIVIASRDPKGATHLFGSVAAHVVRHAHCSVYVLRHARLG